MDPRPTTVVAGLFHTRPTTFYLPAKWLVTQLGAVGPLIPARLRQLPRVSSHKFDLVGRPHSPATTIGIGRLTIFTGAALVRSPSPIRLATVRPTTVTVPPCR